jgi:hypothetical protein
VHVERGFDAKRNIAYVKGTFELPGGLRAIVVGAPEAAPGRLSVVLDGITPLKDLRECKTLGALVNARPMDAVESQAQPKVGAVHIESSFELAVFQPLAGRFPDFAIRACTRKWKFEQAQVAELQKLLAIYADLQQEKAAAGSSSGGDVSPPSSAL